MKLRKELWFGFILMALIVAGTAVMMLRAEQIENGHYGLMMLALVVVAIMLGFPTAFTLMGMGMIFAFFAYHSGGQSASGAITQTLDLMSGSAPPVVNRSTNSAASSMMVRSAEKLVSNTALKPSRRIAE